MLQRFDPKSDATTIQYVKDMGLNAIRFEGTVGNENLYDLADQNGIIFMGGFGCCSAWENDTWTTEQENVAHASLDTQMRNLRAHASAFLWAFGSDQPVSATHLAQYKQIATNLHWQNTTLDNVATWANANAGMKMDGPYGRYGTTTSAADYAKKAELQNYENTRAFFEAWSAHEFTQSFGTIFWMLNGVWPSVHWNLYDWYYEPGGGYFGTKKADEPVHIAYDYATKKVFVVNSTLTARSGMSATATFYN